MPSVRGRRQSGAIRPRSSSRTLTTLLAFAVVFSLGATDSADELSKGTVSDAAELPTSLPPGSGVIESFLGCELPSGSGHWGAVTPADMPWRVSIGNAKTAPRMGTRKEARVVAIESMRQWERAIQTELPWFALEFVMKDRDAPVQITWKRRLTGSAQGRAGPRCSVDGERILAGGAMQISVQGCPTCRPLKLDKITLLVAHEFGHILGLGHCLECDSAMNYSWETAKRVIVTQVDVDAVVRRFAKAVQAAQDRAGTPEPDEWVELAADITPVLYEDVTCKSPFVLKRSCSNRQGPREHMELSGLEVRLAASKDGSVLLMTPDGEASSLIDMGVATPTTNQGFYAVTEAAAAKGVTALRATPLVYGRHVLGYMIEFDGDAWSALGN